MRTEPLVSVITTTFNHAAYIGQCLDSVATQTYPAWEHIVVDDASTDGTTAIVERVAADGRIRLVRHDANWGPGRLADSYNEALAVSRGELVAILDGDDWWAPTRLASQVPLMTDDAVLAYGDCIEVDAGGRRIARLSLPVSSRSAVSAPPENVAFFAGLAAFPANTVLVRRAALERAGGFRSAGPLVDFPTWLELSLFESFVRVPKVIAYWRRHEDSTLWKRWEEAAKAEHRAYADYVERHRGEIAQDTDPNALVAAAGRALSRKLESLDFMDAQHELLYGDARRARQKFASVVLARGAPVNRAAAVAGLVSSVTSPRLFTAALALKRRALPRRYA